MGLWCTAMLETSWSEGSSRAKQLDIDEIRRRLDTHLFGRDDRLLYYPTVNSTNTVAMQLAHERSDEGVIVLADTQTAGKGRQGRRWVDTFGCNVLSSTLLRPLFPPHFLVMIASLAVVEAIASTCDLLTTIKWPNDVLIGDKKVAGILIETGHDRSGRLIAIVGIGVNVNGHLPEIPIGSSLVTPLSEPVQDGKNASSERSSPLLPPATTLETECGEVISREMLIVHLLRRLEIDYLALQLEARKLSPARGPVARSLWERWHERLSTPGRSVAIQQGNTVVYGIAEDVDSDGELILRDQSGTLTRITWGDVGYQ